MSCPSRGQDRVVRWVCVKCNSIRGDLSWAAPVAKAKNIIQIIIFANAQEFAGDTGAALQNGRLQKHSRLFQQSFFELAGSSLAKQLWCETKHKPLFIQSRFKVGRQCEDQTAGIDSFSDDDSAEQVEICGTILKLESHSGMPCSSIFVFSQSCF